MSSKIKYNYQLPISKLRKRRKNNTKVSGQVVLVLVLLTMVGLTIGLSLISRTISDVRISSQIEQSSRAFSAAEAGVETALQATEASPEGTIFFEDSGTTAEYDVSDIGGDTDEIFYIDLTDVNTTQTIWFVPHNEDGTINETPASPYPVSSPITVCWGTQTDPQAKPAIIVSIVYKESGEYKIAKTAYDEDAVTRSPANNFNEPSQPFPGEYCGGSFPLRTDFTPSSDLSIAAGSVILALRIRPVYAATPLAVSPALGESLAVQGKLIQSLGRTETGVVRKIQVLQGYTSLPSLLDFALFSEIEN